MAYHRAGLRAGKRPAGRGWSTNLNRLDVSIRDVTNLPGLPFFIQPAGRGQLPRFCMVDPVKVPDPRAALEAALGPLALFEVLTAPEPAAEAAE